jgi:hypothetical protein
MSSPRQRLLNSVAHISVRSDGESAPESAPDQRRNGLQGNPRGFGTIRIPKRLWHDPSTYGATARLKHIQHTR